MKRHARKQHGLLIALNILLTISLFLAPFISIAEAHSIQATFGEQALSPTETGLDIPTVTEPSAPTLPGAVDPYEIAMNEILADAGLADIPGVARLEPFGTTVVSQAPQIPLPESDVNLPTVSNPFSGLSTTLFQPFDLASFSQPSTNDEPSAFGTNTLSSLIPALADERNDGSNVVPSFSSMSLSDNDERQTTIVTNNTQLLNSIYLPVVGFSSSTNPPPIPSNEIIVTPEEGGLLISIDGRVIVQASPYSFEEPFLLRYTPGQQASDYWKLEAVTLQGDSVVLDKSLKLYLRLPGNLTGNSLVFRYRADNQLPVSIAGYVTTEIPASAQSQSLINPILYLMAHVDGFGEYTFASIDDDGNIDDGDDGLIVPSYCWVPGIEGSDYVFSSANVISTTQAAAPTGNVLFLWEEEDGNGQTIVEYAFIDHDPNPLKNDFTGEPDLVRLGFEEIDGETLPPDYTPIPYSVPLTTSVYIEEPDSGRYDLFDATIAFHPREIACSSGCAGAPPSITGIKLTQIGQTTDPGVGVGFLEIVSGNSAEGVTFSVSVNGIEYPVITTSNGKFVAQVLYNLYAWNLYEVTATDSCGNVINFPPISAFGSNPIFDGQYPCGSCGFQRGLGDPVNTQNGNYYDTQYDLTVPGVGNTDLEIYRAYNSMGALWAGGSTVEYTVDGGGNLVEELVAGPPQYFGPGWTFPYAVSLNHLDYAPLYDGVEITYQDGHTARFVNQGGVYVSSSPTNYDTLTKEVDGWTLTHKITLEVERFDVNGRLIERQDANGNHVLFTYVDDYLMRVENDSGRWIEFDYTDGYITTITAPEGRVIEYGYTDGLLTTVTDGNGHTTTYTYNADNQLTSIQTPNGYTSMVQGYDDQHRVDWQQIGRAGFMDFEYSEDGLTTTVTDNYGNTTTHTYNELGQLILSENARGFTEAFGYDPDFNRTFYQDLEGREWHWTFDDQGNRLTEDGPLGWHQEWAYNGMNRVISQTAKIADERFRTTLYNYDLVGNLTQITDTLNYTSTIAYNDRGLPERIVDFSGNVIVNEYHAVTGDLILTRNGAGDEIRYEYDDLGRMVKEINGRGFEYIYTYDDADNLTDINGPLGYHQGYRYDDNDNLVQEIDPNNGNVTYVYDESEMMIRATNQLSYTTVFTYNDMDKLVGLEDAEGRVWTYKYDTVYNQTAIHGPEDTHIFYQYNGVNRVTDLTECNSPLVGGVCEDNRVTHYEYDDLDRVRISIENYKEDQPETADTNITTKYQYDIIGTMRVMTDTLDHPTFYTYNDRDELIRREDAENQVTRYDYDGNGLMVQMVNARGYTTTYSYEGANRLATIVDPDDNLYQYVYDHNGNLIDEIDPLGVITHYQYDALDRVSHTIQNYIEGEPNTADQNVTTRFEYDTAGNLRFVYDPRGGYVTEHRYDAAHRLEFTIDNEGGVTHYEYDKVNNLIHVTDANTHTTSFIYDDLNRQVAITNPEGHSIGFVYDRLGNTLVITDARGNPTTFTYDGMNRVVLMVDALGGEWEYEYDAMGNVQCAIDANDHANNCYTYDDVYRILTSTDAEEHTDHYTYDPNGNPLTWTDGNDHTTTYTYDVLDRLATVTNAENETTTYQYDPLGNQTHLIEADGIVTRYDYDSLYRLIAVNQNDQPGQPESADVNVDTHYIYDEVGNLLTILDANEHETNFEYDGLNRQTREVDADFNEWTYQYDPVGNRTVRIDANGNRTDYTYYPDNQLHTISYALDGTSVSYLYDENNNRTHMTDWLGTTTWAYDLLNRVTDVTDALGRHLGYGYDPVSNRTSLEYADGRMVQYSYYDNNWLQTVTDPEGNVTSYIRDGVSLMTHTDNPNSTISDATYDKANRMLTLVNQQVGGAGDVISAFAYTYNEIGHRTQMVAEYSWRNPAMVTSDYTYDGLRRLVRDEDSEGVWNEYVYDRVGNRLELHTNDDASSPRPFDEQHLYYSYSDSNRLLLVIGDTHPGHPSTKRWENVAQTIYAFRHEVEAQRGKHIQIIAADNLLYMVDDLITLLEGNPPPSAGDVAVAIEAIRVQVLSDRAGGLIDNDGLANSLLVKLDRGDGANNGAGGDWQTQTFAYDPNGNRINKEFPGPQGPQVQGTDYSYDPENRLIEAQDYQMNQQGHRGDRAVTTLAYNGGGRRLVKTYDPNVGGGGHKRVEYVFDGLDPIAEYNIWNPQYENFYRGELNRIMTLHHFPSGTAGQMYWYHYDGLGSTTGLTKQSGQSHHNYRYEAYGEIEHAPGNHVDPHNHYTFTGQEWDENMGLYEFFARDYDPVTGIWLSQDIYRGISMRPATMHRYMYVEATPINMIDLYGFSGTGSSNNLMCVEVPSSSCSNLLQEYENELPDIYDEYEDFALALDNVDQQSQDISNTVMTMIYATGGTGLLLLLEAPPIIMGGMAVVGGGVDLVSLVGLDDDIEKLEEYKRILALQNEDLAKKLMQEQYLFDQIQAECSPSFWPNRDYLLAHDYLPLSGPMPSSRQELCQNNIPNCKVVFTCNPNGYCETTYEFSQNMSPLTKFETRIDYDLKPR